ncbi:hypothetical protein MBAV_003046 [Candidatus Magnetobacterium bavaricum]|uniref:Uncharacterized protein n=1 Tax=Candidatus Magnetobacterium bavaricum TaxID=29290 RepID=A0A0F3GVS5_9BACT|nr:hypothetical protein MBAV_003046 [Candidatus Magnetobacterium bavaricum]
MDCNTSFYHLSFTSSTEHLVYHSLTMTSLYSSLRLFLINKNIYIITNCQNGIQ